MTKKAYIKPTIQTVELRQRTTILSVGSNAGVNDDLQEEEVDYGW